MKTLTLYEVLNYKNKCVICNSDVHTNIICENLIVHLKNSDATTKINTDGQFKIVKINDDLFMELNYKISYNNLNGNAVFIKLKDHSVTGDKIDTTNARLVILKKCANCRSGTWFKYAPIINKKLQPISIEEELAIVQINDKEYYIYFQCQNDKSSLIFSAANIKKNGLLFRFCYDNLDIHPEDFTKLEDYTKLIDKLLLFN